MAYCTCPGWLWWWRILWNEDWQGKPKYSEKTCPSATLSTTNPTWPDPGSNPGRRGGKSATNPLSYGAANLGTSWRRYTSHSDRLKAGTDPQYLLNIQGWWTTEQVFNVKVHIGTEPRPPIPQPVNSLTELQARLRNSATLIKNWLLLQFHATIFISRFQQNWVFYKHAAAR
jgi:hypothetical protein